MTTTLRPILDELEADQRVLANEPIAYRAGATEHALTKLAAAYPELPEEVYELLRWHDGQAKRGARGEGPGPHHAMHRAWAMYLNGVDEILALASRYGRDLPYLPLYSPDDDRPMFWGIALSGEHTGALYFVDLTQRGDTMLCARSLRLWIEECHRLRRGARRDVEARHPGDVPVTPSQAYKLALSGTLTEENGGSHTVLSTFRAVVGASRYLASLNFWWGLRTRADLVETIVGLLEEPSNVAYDGGRAVFLARAGVATTFLEHFSVGFTTG